MRVVVIGANGFIGSHVVRLLLENGHDVTVVVRPGVNEHSRPSVATPLHFVSADLLSSSQIQSALARCDAEVCLQLAWCAKPPDYQRDIDNLAYASATQSLATALRDGRITRLVAIGTCAEYDWEFGYLSESTPLRPRSLYAACKAATFLTLVQLAQEIGLQVAWVRPFFLYGPGEHPDRFVASSVRSLLNDEQVMIKNPRQIRDYLYVEDVARGIVAVTESSIVGPVNLGSGTPVSLGTLIRAAARPLNREHLVDELTYAGRDEPFPLVCANNRRLCSETSWRPKYSLDEGMARTVAWWERQLAGEKQ